jgi:2-polyprenyl-3-methyl-5-hydroxy-6-metoxy-1,4-benzoquinol methylase
MDCNRPQHTPISASSINNCEFCGSHGQTVYTNLADRLFTAPGNWNVKRCGNQQCAAMWLDPMPAPSELGAFYETYYTHHEADERVDTTRLSSGTAATSVKVKSAYVAQKYGFPLAGKSIFSSLMAAFTWLTPLRRARLDHSVMFLPAVPGGRLLDVGCGNGGNIRRLCKLGWKAEGLDFDQAAVDTVKAQGLTATCGSLTDRPFPEASFDAVILSHVIEHVPNQAETVSECFRLLKPGGRLVMLTPNVGSIGHKMMGQNWMALDPPRHLYLHTVPSMTSLLTTVGFNEPRVFSTARETAKILRASMLIADRVSQPLSKRGSWWQRRKSHLLAMTELCFLLAGNQAVGSELVAVAVKPKSTATTITAPVPLRSAA